MIDSLFSKKLIKCHLLFCTAYRNLTGKCELQGRSHNSWQNQINTQIYKTWVVTYPTPLCNLYISFPTNFHLYDFERITQHLNHNNTSVTIQQNSIILVLSILVLYLTLDIILWKVVECNCGRVIWMYLTWSQVYLVLSVFVTANNLVISVQM